MNKKHLSLLLIFASLNLTSLSSNAQTTHQVPLLSPSKVLSLYDFNYNDVKTYIYKKEKTRNIDILVNHIAKEHRVPLPYIKEVIYTLYNESEKAQIDPILFLSLIEVESSFDQFAKSHVGAVGLSQVMPIHHQSKIATIEKENLDLWSIKGNIKVGVQVLKEYVSLSKGNVEEALQRYNGSLNDGTKTYSRKVLTGMRKYKSLFS